MARLAGKVAVITGGNSGIRPATPGFWGRTQSLPGGAGLEDLEFWQTATA
jgi:hypothetical protein